MKPITETCTPQPDVLSRVRSALADVLGDGDDLAGPWATQRSGRDVVLTLDPSVAAESEAELAVWGNPSIDPGATGD